MARQAELLPWANIPPEANRKDPICFSKYLYRARNLVERFFNKIKYFRRIATRYDKLAALKLAAIRIWLRDNESTSYYFWSRLLLLDRRGRDPESSTVREAEGVPNGSCSG